MTAGSISCLASNSMQCYSTLNMNPMQYPTGRLMEPSEVYLLHIYLT